MKSKNYRVSEVRNNNLGGQTMLKKALSTLLAVAMVITMLPMNVFATSEEPVAEPAAVVETVPSEPAPETPAEPADETPIEPVEPAEPAEPAGETPIGETPVEPAGDEPKAEEPVEEAPVGETPIEPAGETPVGETPIEPEDDTPKAEEPADETPVEESVAFSATEVVGGTKIEINAAAGVFPNGTTVKIAEVTAAVEGAIEGAVDGEVTAMRAFDISFYNAEGVEIQPNGDVNVRFTLSVADAPAVAAADTTEVFHMADAAAAPEKVAETAATNNIAVDVDAFSIYVLVNSKQVASGNNGTVEYKTAKVGDRVLLQSDKTYPYDMNTNGWTFVSGREYVERINYSYLNNNKDNISFSIKDSAEGKTIVVKRSSQGGYYYNAYTETYNITVEHSVQPDKYYANVVTAEMSTSNSQYTFDYNGKGIKIRFEDEKGVRLNAGITGEFEITSNFANGILTVSDALAKQIEGYTYNASYFYYEGHTQEQRNKVTQFKLLDNNNVYGNKLQYYTVDGNLANRWADYNDTGVLHLVYTKNAPATYTVSFDLNGHGSGNAPATQTVEKNKKADGPANPTDDAFNFEGWYTKDQNGNLSANAFNFNTKINKNVELFAKWTAKTYQVTYNANGGTGAPASQTKIHGENLTLSTGTKPTRSGFIFKGWSDGINTYTENTVYTVNAALTLTAQWEAEPVAADIVITSPSVSRDYNGRALTATYASYTGTLDSGPLVIHGWKYGVYQDKLTYAVTGSQTEVGSSSNTVSNVRITRESYAFGLYDYEDVTSEYTVGIVNGTLTVTAVVTFDNNGHGGAAPAQITGITKDSIITAPTAPTDASYEFGGWYTDSACTDGNEWDFDNDTVSASMTLYAKWTQNTYTVTYYDEDGTTELDTVTGALGSDGNYDGVVNPPVKAQTAQYTYAFSGWEYVSGTALEEGKIAGHAAYKASYTPTLRTYTVTIGVAPAGYGAVSETTIEKVPYGAAISVTDNVLTVGDKTVTATEAAKTAQYTYSFANWTGVNMTAGAKVEGDVNVTANFKADVNKYTVKFVDGDKLISEGTFDYGTEIVNPTAPTKDTTEDDKHVFHVFDFVDWTVKEGTFEAAEEKKLVNGDVTFEASFKETRKVYAGFYVAVVNPTQFATQAELDAWQRAYGTSRPSVNNFFTVRKCNDKNQVVEITLPDLTPEIIPSTYETWVFVNGNGITPFLGSNLSTINAEAVAKADSLNIAHDNNDVTWYAIKRENDGWHVDGFMKATWAHTVNFYMNVEANETAINTQTVIHNKTAKTFADPTRTGYTFGGWYSNANCTGDAFSFKTAILSDRNLYAKWTANNYQVIFNGNGATNTFPTVPTSSVNATYSQTFTYDETKALSANLFEKVGHTFAGWNTAADGSGDSYTDKQSVKNLVALNGGTITLYAQWTVNKYTLTYNNNLSGADALTKDGGSYDYDTNATVVDNMFTAPDHKYFTGWNTSANGIGGTSYAASNEIKITEDTVLYAQWGEKNDVKISISGEKIEKPYDGTEYTAGYEVTGIPANSGITVELKNGLTGSVARTDVGTTPLTLTEDMFTVSAGSEYNVTVEVNNGYVKINPLTVSFRTEGASKTYDGAVLKNEVGEIFGLLNGETAHLNYTGAQVNAGSSDNTAEIVFDTAKADNYFIDTQAVSLGKLEVSPVAIEITADSASKVWDGTPLTANGYKITDGAFIGTEGFDTVTVTGSQLPVGDSPNRITNYTFKAGTISINYDVTTVAGTLTVYERPYIYPPVTPPTTPTTIITPPVIPLAPTDGYTITFVDYDGTVIRTGSFDLGDTVSFPAGPSRENYDFSEWTLATGTELGIGNTVQGDATYMANYMSTAERTINDPSIPLANGGEGWALLNLILTVITALTSALMIVGYFTKKKNGKKEAAKSKTAARFGTLVPALGAIITFFLTENMNSKMIFSDKYTLLMAAIALVGIAVSAFAISEKKNKAKAK